MFDALLSIIAPHYCYGCGKVGVLLCEDCKNYITKEPTTDCLLCGRAWRKRQFCPSCGVWCLTKRTGVVEQLLDDFKFNREYAAAKVLAELLDDTLPEFSATTVLVPVPTAPANIRRRGYDHMVLVTKSLAKKRGLKHANLLRRRSNITQHFAKTAAQRRRQARHFFEISTPPDPDASYLLIDDIYTTGSTLKAAKKCLKDAGATDIKCVVIARQSH